MQKSNTISPDNQWWEGAVQQYKWTLNDYSITVENNIFIGI